MISQGFDYLLFCDVLAGFALTVINLRFGSDYEI